MADPSTSKTSTMDGHSKESSRSDPAAAAATMALQKTRQAVSDIRNKLQPVLGRLKKGDSNKGGFGGDEYMPQAQATVALSIGMMRYMGARLRGLDQGRADNDPLRQELNKMKAVLAEIKKRGHGKAAATRSNTTDEKRDGGKPKVSDSRAGATDPTHPLQQETPTPETTSGDANKKRKQQPAGKPEADKGATNQSMPKASAPKPSKKKQRRK